MNLYLLRHADAEPAAGPGGDRERPLSAKGEAQSQRVGKALKALEIDFHAILTSPLLRARQTAEIVARSLRATARLRVCEALASGGATRQLIAELKRLGEQENILMVGHEPDMSRLISLLLAGEPPVDVEMKKAGLCYLELRQPIGGRCATLKWLVPPKLLNL